MVIATGDGQVFKDRFEQLSAPFRPAEEEGNDLSSGRMAEGSRYPNPFEDIGKYTPKAPTSAPEPPKPLWPHELLSPQPPALWHWEHQGSLEQKAEPPHPKSYERGHQDFEQRFPKDYHDPNYRQKPFQDFQPTFGPIHVDNNHHVPLIASATMDDSGNMTGLAIDHRVDVPKEYLPHLALHEATELPLMHDYMADGMSEQDAYHKAHDIATAVESASVRGYAARNGLDVDSYHEGYKQFFRDAAGTAGEPSDRQRHPTAHTTVHGLDEAEGAYKVAGDVVEGNFPQRVQHPPLEIDLLSGKMPQGVGIAKGAKAEQKTKDIEQSASTRNSPYFKKSGASMQKLDFATMKRDQYQNWMKPEVGTVRKNIPANENYIKTQMDSMEELVTTNPDLYKYFRAKYKQEGGKAWENWKKVEDMIEGPYMGEGERPSLLEGAHGKPTKGGLEVIKGGKEDE